MNLKVEHLIRQVLVIAVSEMECTDDFLSTYAADWDDLDAESRADYGNRFEYAVDSFVVRFWSSYRRTFLEGKGEK